MTRSLLVTVVLAISCLGGGVAAFIAGRSSGPDLTVVARAGMLSGARAGSRAGASTGRAAGYHAGYSAGYRRSYATAYRSAYQRALGQ
ncbi:MAG TPA: hypothetical protein VMD09_10305 [Solirubrobacteraceae bacterium]|nr:hypothetical protein [Solirubrobacteraceae bacterium]